jgi:hypothetical protein
MLASRFFALAFTFFLAALGMCASARPAVAQQPADQATIDQTINLGVRYLKKAQKPSGFWGDGTGAGSGKGWGIGYTALTGLTLVECGVPVTDPGIKRAAIIVRGHAADIDSPYELALAILFLDRLKDKDGKLIDKGDKRIIQLLAGRLIAGQMPSGGWGYKVPKYGESEIIQLLNALRKMTPPRDMDDKDPDNPSKKQPFDLEKARKAAIAGLQGTLKQLPVLYDPGAQLPADPLEPNPKEPKKRNDQFDAITDNSNTHFAMLGVWAARKHDVPVERTLTLLNRRFRTSQGAGGTWAYDFVRTGADGSGAFACVALLGIAIGHVIDPPPGVKPEADPVILKAFVSLSKLVGEPAGDIKNRPKIKDVGGLYYLWAMERIAVLYDVRKLGKKDWYIWGAEILICNQKGDGVWSEDGGYPGQTPLANTCLALLFLRRANLTPDLSKQLVVDPGILTSKVDETVTPKPEPPPSPKVEETPVIAIAPPPHTVEPKPQPVVTPPPPPSPEPEPVAAPPAKKSPVLWIVLGVLLAGILGIGLFFLVAKRQKEDEDEDEEDEDEEEDEKPKKKKGKKKAKNKAEKSAKAGATKKVKAKAKAEEDEE